MTVNELIEIDEMAVVSIAVHRWQTPRMTVANFFPKLSPTSTPPGIVIDTNGHQWWLQSRLKLKTCCSVSGRR